MITQLSIGCGSCTMKNTCQWRRSLKPWPWTNARWANGSPWKNINRAKPPNVRANWIHLKAPLCACFRWRWHCYCCRTYWLGFRSCWSSRANRRRSWRAGCRAPGRSLSAPRVAPGADCDAPATREIPPGHGADQERPRELPPQELDGDPLLRRKRGRRLNRRVSHAPARSASAETRPAAAGRFPRLALSPADGGGIGHANNALMMDACG